MKKSRPSITPTQSQTPKELPTEPTFYPSGIAVKTEKGTWYMHPNGTRLRITSKAILQSWNFPFVVEATESALSNYKIAYSRLGFRDGSLLTDISDGRMYVVSNGALRHIKSVEFLERMDISEYDSQLVSNADIQIMRMGESIT